MTKVKLFKHKNKDPREESVEDSINKFIENNPKIKVKDIVYGGMIHNSLGDEKKTESYFLLVYEDEGSEISK